MRAKKFECEGKGLADWLLEAVGRDAARRARAADVVLEMQLGFSLTSESNPDAEVGAAQHDTRFRKELERVLLDPEFPGPEVVEGIIAIMTGSHAKWLKRVGADQRNEKQAADEIIRQITGADQRARARAAERLAAVCRTKTSKQETAETGFGGNVSISCLFVALGRGLLLAQETVRSLLKHKTHRWAALDAIDKAGAAVADAFEDAIYPPEGPDLNPSTVGVSVSMGRFDPRVVSHACARIERALDKPVPKRAVPSSDSTEYRRYFHNYYSVWPECRLLNIVGPLARENRKAGAQVLPLLLRLCDSDHAGRRGAGAFALGVWANGDQPKTVQKVADRLLELTAENAWVAGYAAQALGELVFGVSGDLKRLGIDADKIIRRLIEMIDTYDEPDEDIFPDERVCSALASFGPAAAAALPRLRKLAKQRAREDSDEMAQGVIEAIETIRGTSR